MSPQAVIAMKKPIEIWQAIIGTLAMFLTVGTIIVNQSNKITVQQERIIFLEQTSSETKTTLHEMSAKLTDILIALRDKQDRK